ncbi:hypothetical protein O181_032691 [Austropuccinia psidii MF-1]|uniref:Uncharacterized protein n=1 Tax=Austropuccinia psidii MF-1 TaxID=1389203 RepID=A0A9Q3CXA3_9BASI|nr:hypothetical protein [Austropuccinia psidii MF-1]
MDKDTFNLASYWAELQASFQKIFRREITFKDLMEITKGWNPTKKNQQISGQESPTFTIPGSFQEKIRIQGKKQDLIEPKADGVRTNDPELFKLGERSTKEPGTVVNTSRISNPGNRNIIPTQTEHNVVTPENNLNSDKQWLKMSKFAVTTQE